MKAHGRLEGEEFLVDMVDNPNAIYLADREILVAVPAQSGVDYNDGDDVAIGMR